MERRNKKKYSVEFKLEAVRLSNESGKPITQVARDLNIPVVALYRWRDEMHRDGAKAFPGKGKKTNVSPEKLELERLRRENKQLREERDVLKKSLVFFAKEEAQNSVSSSKNAGDSQ